MPAHRQGIAEHTLLNNMKYFPAKNHLQSMVCAWGREGGGTKDQRDKTANTSLLKQLRHSVLELGKTPSDVVVSLFGFCYFTQRKVQPLSYNKSVKDHNVR